MKPLIIFMTLGTVLSLSAVADQQISSSNEGMVKMAGDPIKFGVLSEVMHSNPVDEVDSSFNEIALQINNSDLREQGVLSALDRIARIHPILAKKLIETFKKNQLPIKYIKFYEDPLPLPDGINSPGLGRLFLWSDISHSYLVDMDIYRRLPSLDQSKMTLYMLLEQLGFATPPERLEALVNFIYSRQYSTTNISTAVTFVEEALNLRLSELPVEITQTVNQNWLKVEKKRLTDLRVKCFKISDLHQAITLANQSDGLIKVTGETGQKKGILLKNHELDYIQAIISAIHSIESAHQYQNLYGRGSEKKSATTEQICFDSRESKERPDGKQLTAIAFDFSGSIDALPSALDEIIPKYHEDRNDLAAERLQVEYEKRNEEYLKTWDPAKREALGDHLNGLNIQILGIESGLSGPIASIDEELLKTAFGSKDHFSYQIVISFEYESGPILDLIDLEPAKKEDQSKMNLN